MARRCWVRKNSPSPSAAILTPRTAPFMADPWSPDLVDLFPEVDLSALEETLAAIDLDALLGPDLDLDSLLGEGDLARYLRP